MRRLRLAVAGMLLLGVCAAAWLHMPDVAVVLGLVGAIALKV